MQTKTEYIESLWKKKHTSEIILILHELVDNSMLTKEDKESIFAVMKGIITYTDRGDELFDHHREWLNRTWKRSWDMQKNNKVKVSIKDWLI